MNEDSNSSCVRCRCVGHNSEFEKVGRKIVDDGPDNEKQALRCKVCKCMEVRDNQREFNVKEGKVTCPDCGRVVLAEVLTEAM